MCRSRRRKNRAGEASHVHNHFSENGLTLHPHEQKKVLATIRPRVRGEFENDGACDDEELNGPAVTKQEAEKPPLSYLDVEFYREENSWPKEKKKEECFSKASARPPTAAAPVESLATKVSSTTKAWKFLQGELRRMQNERQAKRQKVAPCNSTVTDSTHSAANAVPKRPKEECFSKASSLAPVATVEVPVEPYPLNYPVYQ